jgi:hypothetical protein
MFKDLAIYKFFYLLLELFFTLCGLTWPLEVYSDELGIL